MELKEKIKEYKKELILRRCGEYLEKNGFEKTKMADLAKYCDISIGALYKIFPSKDELFFEYVNLQIDDFYNNLKEKFKTIDNPKERLRYFILLKFKTFSTKKTLLKDTIAGDPLFFAKLNANKKNPAGKIYDLISKEFENIDKTTPLKIKDFKRVSYLFNAMSYGYIEYWLINDKVNLEDFSQEALDIFLKGIL